MASCRPAGDPQIGWDTDQFLTDPREATLVMGVLLKNGGLGSGGINFDAKLRYSMNSMQAVAALHSGAHSHCMPGSCIAEGKECMAFSVWLGVYTLPDITSSGSQ